MSGLQDDGCIQLAILEIVYVDVSHLLIGQIFEEILQYNTFLGSYHIGFGYHDNHYYNSDIEDI